MKFVPSPRAVAKRPFLDTPRLLVLTLAGVLITCKLGVPLGKNQIEAPFFLVVPTLVVLTLRGRTTFDPVLVAVSAALVFFAAISDIFAAAFFSVPSFLFLLVMTFVLTLRIRLEPGEYERILDGFTYIVLGVAGAVFLQHASQLASGPFFDVEQIIPKPFLFVEYVYRQPLAWGWNLEKPNGIILLEASVTSQVLALGMITEFCRRARTWVLLLLGLALLGTFAGTGLLLLVLTAPLLLPRLNRSLLVFLVLAMPIVLVIGISVGWMDIVVQRLAEFDHPGRSANSRFVQPVQLMWDTVFGPDYHTLLFGVGSGNLRQELGTVWFAPAKMLGEYGAAPFLAFVAFVVRWLYVGRPSATVCVAASWTFLFLNGSLLVPLFTFLPHLLGAGYISPPLRSRAASDGRSGAPANPARTLHRFVSPSRPQLSVE